MTDHLPYRGTAGMHWRATSLIELCHAVDHCADNHGEAHVYLHNSRWLVVAEARNDLADDHVGTWRRVPRDKLSAQHADIDRKALSAMRSEVA